MVINAIIAIVVGYLLGSIPFAYIAGRLKKGVDIRQVGGGNLGTLNTLREIGLLPGLAVLIADIAKGSLTVLIAQWLDLSLIWIFVAGFACVVGHVWPVFLKFKGGRGAATTIGVFLGLVPPEAAISLAIIVIIIIVTSNFRLAIIIGLAFLPLIVWQLNGSVMLIAYSLALPVFLVIRNLTSFREPASNTGSKKNLIFDRDYHFWQSRRK
ncbi:MAG TPA: glycerol-3-phosphate acyltransferase [Dehalococcoidales bacterium]|nr:glycerol-3-phosphate acyltransferase [Dehalococcoidales bacterium]